MALGAAGASLIGAGIAATAQGANAIAQGKMNRRTMKFNKEMYDLQRKDALTDWERNNAYNSPQAQMQRLQEAGLNPNLVYGTGSATQNTPPPPQVDFKAPQMRAPQFDGGQVADKLNQFYDFKIKQAQYDNLMTDNTVKEAQRLEILSKTARQDFDLNFERGLEAISADARRASLEKLQADTAIALNADQRAAIAQEWDIAKAVETIATMKLGREATRASIGQIKQNIENMKKEGELKDLHINLRKMGLEPSDELWQRQIALKGQRLIENINRDGGSFLQKVPGMKQLDDMGFYKYHKKAYNSIFNNK